MKIIFVLMDHSYGDILPVPEFQNELLYFSILYRAQSYSTFVLIQPQGSPEVTEQMFPYLEENFVISRPSMEHNTLPIGTVVLALETWIGLGPYSEVGVYKIIQRLYSEVGVYKIVNTWERDMIAPGLSLAQCKKKNCNAITRLNI